MARQYRIKLTDGGIMVVGWRDEDCSYSAVIYAPEVAEVCTERDCIRAGRAPGHVRLSCAGLEPRAEFGLNFPGELSTLDELLLALGLYGAEIDDHIWSSLHADGWPPDV